MRDMAGVHDVHDRASCDLCNSGCVAARPTAPATDESMNEMRPNMYFDEAAAPAPSIDEAVDLNLRHGSTHAGWL